MREKIHVLLLGDGGILKQSLLSYVASLAPCASTYSAIGSNANKMGLTLTVQQLHSDTHWYLEGKNVNKLNDENVDTNVLYFKLEQSPLLIKESILFLI
jgi:hypothetical protein